MAARKSSQNPYSSLKWKAVPIDVSDIMMMEGGFVDMEELDGDLPVDVITGGSTEAPTTNNKKRKQSPLSNPQTKKQKRASKKDQKVVKGKKNRRKSKKKEKKIEKPVEQQEEKIEKPVVQQEEKLTNVEKKGN